MEFHSDLTQLPADSMARGWNGPLPFYMAYPGILNPRQEAAILQDLEYLQQLYPGDVKRYQRRVAEILEWDNLHRIIKEDCYRISHSLAPQMHAPRLPLGSIESALGNLHRRRNLVSFAIAHATLFLASTKRKAP